MGAKKTGMARFAAGITIAAATAASSLALTAPAASAESTGLSLNGLVIRADVGSPTVHVQITNKESGNFRADLTKPGFTKGEERTHESVQWSYYNTRFNVGRSLKKGDKVCAKAYRNGTKIDEKCLTLKGTR